MISLLISTIVALNLNSRSIKRNGDVVSSDIRRNTLYAYLQDKIYIGNNVELTPALRYVHYSSYSR